MTTTDDFESHVRNALARAAAEVPSDVSRRLVARRYRTGRRRPLVAAVAALAAVVIGIATALTVSGGSTPVAANGLHWRLVSDVGTPGWQVISPSRIAADSLTCPTATTCYEEGSTFGFGKRFTGVVEVTHNGGRTWTHWTMPARWSSASQQGPECASATSCFTALEAYEGHGLFSLNFYVTSDGGLEWTARPGPTKLPNDLVSTAMSCPSAVSCVAILGSEGFGADSEPRIKPRALVTTDGWRTWREVALPDTFEQANVQCFADERCIAAGLESVPGGFRADNLYSDDGGRVWVQAVTPPGTGQLGLGTASAGISCGSPTHCIELNLFSQSADAGHPGVLATTDGGKRWSEVGRLPAGIAGGGVACSSAAACWAGVVVDNPTKQLPSIYLDRFANPGHVLYATRDGGHHWTGSVLPGHVLSDPASGWGLSCPTDTSCYSLGYEGERLVLLASG